MYAGSLTYEALKMITLAVKQINALLKPFYYQLMHIMLKNTELLKHSKITLHVTLCNLLNTVYLYTVHDTHVLQVTICSHSTDDALHMFYADSLNQMCNF